MQEWEEREIARREAIAEGRAEGRAKGRAEGRAEGRARGVSEEKKRILELLRKGYSAEEMMKLLEKEVQEERS